MGTVVRLHRITFQAQGKRLCQKAMPKNVLPPALGSVAAAGLGILQAMLGVHWDPTRLLAVVGCISSSSLTVKTGTKNQASADSDWNAQ